MKKEFLDFGRKKKSDGKPKNRNFFEDEYSPSKKELVNQYKRREKHRNNKNWGDWE